MRKTLYRIAPWLICFLLLTACSAPNTAMKPAVWPHEDGDLAPDPAVRFGRLDNGLRYVMLPNDTPEDRVSMHLDIQAGSLNETDDQQGLAHFLEHMLFNGSTHFPPGELIKYFQRIGMDFGPDVNAHTGFDETVYHLLLPTGDRESLAEGLLVLSDYAQGTMLLPDEVARERKVILEEKRARDSAGFRTFMASLAFEMPDTLVPERLPIGTEEDIRNADRDQLKDFYDTWYRPEKMVLVMVGDFDPDMAETLITERFADMTARAPARPAPDFGTIRHEGIQVFHHYEPESGSTDVTLQVLQQVPPPPDTIERKRRELLLDVADQIMRNRLDRRIGQAGTPFTRASASTGLFLRQVKYAALNAETSPENWRDTLTDMEKMLRKALTYGFTEEELRRVKKDYLSQLDENVKTAPTRDSNRLARLIIHNLNDHRVFQSPKQEKNLLAPMLEAMTVDDVNAAYREAWNRDHRMVMVTGNAPVPETAGSPEDYILTAYTQSAAEPVAPPEMQKAVVFPYLPESETGGRIANRQDDPDLGIIRIDYENGFRLNLKKTDFKANEVTANLIFGQGRASEPVDKPGLSELSEALLKESGLDRLTREELERALAGHQTVVRFDVNESAFAFEGRTITEEVPLMFQLMTAGLLDPGFRPEAYDLVMERFRQQYLEYPRTVDGMMTLAGKHFLAGGDSRFGMPPYDEFKRLTLGDAQNWLEKPFREAPLELSIVGDFDVDQVIRMAGRYFGTLPERLAPMPPARTDLPDFPEGQSLVLTAETKIDKGMVRVGFPTDDIWNIQRTRRLSTLAGIFSDRLREEIREKLGATYSPAAFNMASRTYPGYGMLQAVITVNPQQSEAVVSAVKEIAASLASDGATADELDRVLLPTLNSIKDMRQQNNYWLDIVLTGCREHPEQIEWSRTIIQDYRSISTADMSEYARTYLMPDKSAVVVVLPDASETRHAAQ